MQEQSEVDQLTGRGMTSKGEERKMQSESDEQLTGMALDQAVVRAKWPDAWCKYLPASKDFYVMLDAGGGTASYTGKGVNAPEAWANAADKVIEAEGYYFRNAGVLWWWNNREYGGPSSFPTRALALESAKRDYIARSRRLEPKLDAAGEARVDAILTELGITRPTVEEILAEWADGGAYGERSYFIREFSKTALAYIESLKSAPHSRDQSDLRESWQSAAGDRMAQAIANLVHLRRLDSRSEASDAMLDYMGNRGVPAPTVERVLPAEDLRESQPPMGRGDLAPIQFKPEHYAYGTGIATIEDWAAACRAREDELIEALHAIADLRDSMEAEERAHMQTIGERDAAEDALGDMYALVTGELAEWSNVFGYPQALEEAETTLADLRESHRKLQEAAKAMAEAIEPFIQTTNDIYVDDEQRDALEPALALYRALEARNG